MRRKLFSPFAVMFSAIFILSLAIGVMDEPWESPGLVVFALAVLSLCVSVIVLFRRALKRANEGISLLLQGRYQEALSLQERLTRGWIPIAGVRHNQGVTLLALWRLDEARELLARILEHPWEGEKTLHYLTRPSFALTHALMGNADAARENLLTSTSPIPTAILAGAVLAMRKGQFEKVEEALNGPAAANLSGRERALAEALIDWSRLESGRAPGHTPHRDRLFGTEGTGTLPAHWPELLAAIDRLEAARPEGLASSA